MFEDQQNLANLTKNKEYSVFGESGVVYETIEHGDPAQYNDRPRQVEDGVYNVLGESAAGPSVPWQTSTLAEVDEDDVYNTLDN